MSAHHAVTPAHHPVAAADQRRPGVPRAMCPHPPGAQRGARGHRPLEQEALRLRVDAPVALGRMVLAPALPRFLDRYPEVRLDLTLRDHHIDPVTEGIDLLVRIGALGEANLMVRRLGASRILHCAAPSYIRERGAPASPTDLACHECLGYLRNGQPAAFKFVAGGTTYATDIAGRCHANDADVLLSLALAGKGITALFDFVARAALERGKLVTVLDDYPSTTWPIHALYPKNRHLVPKVGVFLEFLAGLLKPRASR
jgi:DNA-binding transcriptional LysR family regulator